MKYKVGNKVRIKSIDWYNENKNIFGKVWTSGGQIPLDKCMSVWCGKVMTISHVRADHYTMVEDLEGYWTDEMIEGLADETEIAQDAKTFSEGYVQGYEDGQHDMNEWTLPEGFEFTDENGNVINATKIVLEKKKKEYPRTYEECCKVLGHFTIDEVRGHKAILLNNLQMLLICRDAYWKIAGEEMGLGKSWKPDFKDTQDKYFICYLMDELWMSIIRDCNRLLVFPTEEIRDAFYENFKELIDECKELL